MIFRYQTIAELAQPACGSVNGAVGNGVQVPAAPAVPDCCLPVAPTASQQRERLAGSHPAGVVVESLGIYLRRARADHRRGLEGCRKKLDFPLEHMTGIRSRRMAGETEFSIDLAEKAVDRVPGRSPPRPDDIDLLICCNISRFDGPEFPVRASSRPPRPACAITSAS